MHALRPDVDPDGLLEYSVVYTDRSLNHMSARFRQVMRDIPGIMARAYDAHSTVIVPGGGTFAMEAVARQLATGQRCLVIRNGWFSYRWSQILERGNIAAGIDVLQARPDSEAADAPWRPAPIDTVIAAIEAQRPGVVFAPHVETSAGMRLPGDYLRQVADATHAAGGLFVLDCIASGASWVNMTEAGVDVLISAPQKGWSGPPCAGLVMLNEAARARVETTESSSFACDLGKWLAIGQAYADGGHAYHATMPTDSLCRARDMMRETEVFGFETARQAQESLGTQVRALLRQAGFASVAAEGFEAPGVVVCHTDRDDLRSGRAFADLGVQIAAGVPLMCGEPESYKSFRIGLFGLDKLADVDAAVGRFREALTRVGG